LQNGIYTVTNTGSANTNWILTRVTDFDSPSQMVRGAIVNVINGTENAVTAWMLTSIVTAVGTDSLTFPKLSQNGISNVLGTTNQITVTVNNNIATISIANNPVFTGNGSMTIPNGTTEQRPSTPTVGMMRLNTSL